MADKRHLLVEIGTEELPPQALKTLSDAFASHFSDSLAQRALGYSKIEKFATPRRLALRVLDLDVAQQDQAIVRKGPSLSAAEDSEGRPSKAALGFARSCGVAVSDLAREESPNGSWLVFRKVEPGAATRDLVPEMVRDALAALPIPKRMRWGDLDSEFVRPVHWVVLIFGDESIDAVILDTRCGRTTRGHRFHHPDPILIGSALEYDGQLRDIGRVEPDFDLRKARIRELAETAARSIGALVRIDEEILDEVTSLTEWPVPVLGSFEKEFLEVPSEVLIETMQKNQKYFPVMDREGGLLPRFIAISNIESRDPDQVRQGNERVIRPRFKDAAFFWQQDLQHPLASLISRLDSVVFQHKLGTLHDKSRRMASLAAVIAGGIGLDPALAQRSALLSKCDLLTEMVGEFASLQGIMGRYYAAASGEPSCVSAALEEHYLPRHAGDRLPMTKCGQAIALADRLDSLVGIFAIGQRPTGVKDPYALRRAALGVLRILIEIPLNLDLRLLLEHSAATLRDRVDVTGVVDDVFGYMMDRLQGYYSDKGIGLDVVEAVLARAPTVPLDIDRRIRAVELFRKLPEAHSLASANKRITNILKKSGGLYAASVEVANLVEDSELKLYREIHVLQRTLQPLFDSADYAAALTQLATLRERVDLFFDHVMVMSDDPVLRGNRLALLHQLRELFANVADISLLQQAQS